MSETCPPEEGVTPPSSTPPASAAVATKSSGALDDGDRDLVRSLVMAEPELVLGDDRVMRALIGASAPGGAAPDVPARNIVDLRDKLVERLETRLSKLVHTNRSVIAAAYENVASTGALHAGVLDLMAADDLTGFITALAERLPARVSIATARLCLEGEVEDVTPATALGSAGAGLLVMPRGSIATYLAVDGTPSADGILLRMTPAEAEVLYPGAHAASEALLPLSLGADRTPGLLALASIDPERFSPDQGTELLGFLAAVTARLASHHLAAHHANDLPG
ncbi:MAG: DUF484 family protein [Pseudomonadota bacterium]